MINRNHQVIQLKKVAMEFFEHLDPLLRTFWYIAIPVSLIFVVQTIMTFVGADATDGNEVDFDGDVDFDSGTVSDHLSALL